MLCFPYSIILKMVDLKKCNKLQDFMTQHCKATHYAFQIKKCGSPECDYCSQKPPRLQCALHFMPDPVIAPSLDGEKYKEFDEVFGTDTTDDDRPSRRH